MAEDLTSSGPCCCLVTKFCLTLCNPRNWSTPGFPLLLCILEFAQILVHWVSDAIQLSHPFSSCLQFFLASWSFPTSQLFASGGQSISASATASILPMNIQGWFPLGLTGLISMLSKGLSRVFSSTTTQKHQFIKESTQPSLWSSSHVYDLKPLYILINILASEWPTHRWQSWANHKKPKSGWWPNSAIPHPFPKNSWTTPPTH